MPADVYEILALAMRYVFTFFGVMIVWRAFSWLRKDRRLKHRRLRQLPDAGTIGILTVEQGSRHLREGAMIPVPHEGVLGFLRTCDMVVPVEGVADQHLDFAFQDGKGLYVYPRRGCGCMVDGMEIRTRRDSRAYPMQHNSTLTVGNAVLRLGVFAGLDVAQYVEELELPEVWEAPRHAEIPPYGQMQQMEYPPQTMPPSMMPRPPQEQMQPVAPWPPQNTQPGYPPPYPPLMTEEEGGDDDEA